jgi:hypothetical protein
LPISEQVAARNLVPRNQFVMPLINDLQRIVFDGEFKKSDSVIRHELNRQGPTDQRRKLLFAAFHILAGLNNSKLIVSALGLHGDYELSPMPVNTDVYFVDLDLTQALYSGSKVILK